MNGELWASTMHTDRVVRLNPNTGAVVQYLMPADTNMRTVFIDNFDDAGDVLGWQQPRPQARAG